ncbi:alpha/beta hydrolase [Ferrimonas lipolytica]|uniref:Alpha/beta hydrolase n=1 Tax=Ferrimonas lipolytica TaxID=2724191 RepID=A0A6H1U941_9GAMM|nr:alpha/beta hydrolase [Ferrimonas lipolytica]QIZ75544.1 alpha/beta hydrolase [Ferrimonas lipolytica]
MPSWRAAGLNKVLYRIVRSRLARCEDIHGVRSVVGELEKLGSYIAPPVGVETIIDDLAGVPCDWVTTGKAAGSRIILYFHGGGFCFASPLLHNALLARLAEMTHARGLMANYRMAPEFPFPAAAEDAFAVYEALLQQGYNANNIILAGDSAGGNLVMTTLVAAREHNLPQPAAGVLISPAIDMAVNGDSAFMLRNDDPFFDLGTLLLLRNSYLNGHNPCDPKVSPLYAELHDLAPVMLHVGSLEILQDDSVRLAAQIRRQHGLADLTIWPGMAHVFPLFYQLPESKEAIDRICQFMTQHSGQNSR